NASGATIRTPAGSRAATAFRSNSVLLRRQEATAPRYTPGMMFYAGRTRGRLGQIAEEPAA
ncbi:MAG TPA: hypothetical protein VHT05_14525, partial [Candidatus Elarobacter sp.]|nr:hypothetical protein [Candidatus Elarobacter sp.]